MATTTFDAAPTVATDAEFRAWGTKFSTALATVGMVQTADTGQIDWATVTAPAGPSIDKGYQIWRFNDSLQATNPLFLKLTFGSGAYSGPNVKTNIGRGSSGAGALTSQYSATMNTYIRSNLGTIGTWYMSSMDGSTLCWAIAPSLTAVGDSTWIVIERGRNSSGQPFGGAFWVDVFTPTSSAISNYSFAFNYGSLTAVSNIGSWPIPWVTSVDLSLAYGSSTAPLFPALVTDNLAYVWQPRGVVRGMRLDLPTLLPITIPGWGTYLPLGVSGRPSSSDYHTHALAWS